ncbi:TonB-dependent receptor [Sediminicola luteus]|uniref:TonB-dependent receptor n=1 Tax=Sediminicola luteus TaxID=319238 RepID=A0A2A4GD21_9FLAO|nr:TonB-dependent receptor [Sediminicola luteus]PCE65866.1 TonB-dependent receptor [Sediminicola luteus]
MGQQVNGITKKYENTSIITIIEDLEETYGYRFYFNPVWLEGRKVSIETTNASLTDFLERLFSNTELNYYLQDANQVILLRNNIVYTELPNGFFKELQSTGNSNTVVKAESVAPIFYDFENTQQTESLETMRVGKSKADNGNGPFTVQGKIINGKTGEPIADLVLRAKGTGKRTITSGNGTYSLLLNKGTYEMEALAMGIQDTKFRLIVYDSGVLDLALNESLEQLDEVILEAEAIKNVEDVNTGTNQINSEESKNIPLVLGERDILKVATTLPGISNAGEGASGFNVRGGKTDQNLILLDDGVVYNPTHFFGFFQALNPFTTEGVDIYKGSIPPQFGGRLSSVFDITTKDGNMNELKGEASIGAVTSNIALEVPIKKDKASLIVGGRTTYSDWILKVVDDEQLKNSEASFYDMIAKYTHKINDNHTLRGSAYYSKDKFSITNDSLYNYSNRLFSLSWDHKFNEKHTGKVHVTNSQYQFGIDYDGQANTDFNLGYDVTETEFKYDLNYFHNKDHSFNYGIAAKLYDINPGGIDPAGNESQVTPLHIPKERAIEGALYIGDTYNVSPKLSFNLGLRYSFYAFLGETTTREYAPGLPLSDATLTGETEYDKNEVAQSYNGPEVRVSGRYFIQPDLSIKAGFNTAYQYIHSLSNNTTVSPIDTWKLSDNNIEPQLGYQYSLGVYKNLKENEYELSLEGYYKTSENITDFKTGANILLNETIEQEVLQGDGKAYGVEFLLRKNRGRLNGWLGYAYSRSLQKFDSEFSVERINNGEFFATNYDKPHDFSLVANYKVTNRYSLSTNLIYQSGRPVTYPVGSYRFNNADYVLYSNRNEFRIPNYFRWDIGLNIEGNHRIKKLTHSFWTISVYNVLGRNNPYSVFFVTEDGEIKAYQSSIFAIPVPSISYNIKF